MATDPELIANFSLFFFFFRIINSIDSTYIDYFWIFCRMRKYIGTRDDVTERPGQSTRPIWTLTQRAEHHCMTVCDPDQNTLASLRVRCVVNKTESPQYSHKCSCCMQDLICWLIRSNHFATFKLVLWWKRCKTGRKMHLFYLLHTVNQQILAAIKFGVSQNKVIWRLSNLASPCLCSVWSTSLTYVGGDKY